MQWLQSPLGKLFAALLWLNILDILITIPAFEANPFTLYLWGRIGIFLAACVKIGLVLFLGALVACAKRFATPVEWVFSRKLLGWVLGTLVAFYAFVVAWNGILFTTLRISA